MSWGQRAIAAFRALLKRAARLRQSRRLFDEYSKVNHNTGRPLVSFMTLSMTQAGYHDSGLDNMSFVPRAITIAVVCRVIFDLTVVAPVLAVRPTRASIITRVQILVLRARVAREPNADDPTVSESPTNSTVPWPFSPIRVGRNVAIAACGTKAAPSNANTVHQTATALRGFQRGDRECTVPLWQGGGVMRRHFLTYLALSTMAISQPVLDLYGKNPTVFSASKMSTVETALFVVVVLVVPAVLATVLDRVTRWLGPKVNESMRLWLIAGFSFLLGLAVARWLNVDGNVGSVVLGVLFAAAIPYFYDTKKTVREWSRWLAVLSIAVLANAVLQLQPVLFASDGPTSDAVVGNKDVSVFQIIFDEFPLYALLDDNGEINAERFPGFAALAGESTWFRNAVAESNFTHQAVPALMASAVPKQSGGPFLAQYPQNIFTLFAGKMAVGGIEPVTSLCPSTACPSASTNNSSALSYSRLKSFFRDASYVYAHRVMPPVVRQRVPSIEGRWGGFGAVADKFKEQFDVGALSQVEALLAGVKAFVDDPSPRVQVTHVLLPHAPWRVTPDLRIAPLSKAISTSNPESEDGVRDAYQTFLYQVAAADTTVSQAIADLKQAGRWENTLFIVSADHGISFLPTLPQRHTDFSDMGQSNDIYRVPLMMKFPQQTTAIASDCPVTNLDVLPTIVDVTKTTTSWKWAGTSLVGECPSRKERRVVAATGETGVFDGGFEEARERSDHYDTMVSRRGGPRSIAAVGASADLIGKPLAAVGENSDRVSWTLQQKMMFTSVSDSRGSRVPSLITGTVTLRQPVDIGTEGIVVVDGVAAGVIGELSGARDTIQFTAILDYALLGDGSHVVELFVRNTDGVITRVGAPS